MHLRSWFKHPCDLIPEWQWLSCLLRLFHIACVNEAWEAGFVAARADESEVWPSSRFRCECCHSLIWATTKHALIKLHWHTWCETGVKDIQIWNRWKDIHAAADPERATQTVFSTTHQYFCYRHLNNRSTRIKVYSLGINTYCLLGVDRLSAWPIIGADIKHFTDYRYRPFSKHICR